MAIVDFEHRSIVSRGRPNTVFHTPRRARWSRRLLQTRARRAIVARRHSEFTMLETETRRRERADRPITKYCGFCTLLNRRVALFGIAGFITFGIAAGAAGVCFFGTVHFVYPGPDHPLGGLPDDCREVAGAGVRGREEAPRVLGAVPVELRRRAQRGEGRGERNVFVAAGHHQLHRLEDVAFAPGTKRALTGHHRHHPRHLPREQRFHVASSPSWEHPEEDIDRAPLGVLLLQLRLEGLEGLEVVRHELGNSRDVVRGLPGDYGLLRRG